MSRVLRLLAMGIVPVVCAAPASARDFGDVDRLYTHRDAALAPGFAPKNIGNEIIYQVVVDRFANGNDANDCPWDGRYCSPNHQDWLKYWGGDIRGVIDHLPYLRGLGVTRLWLTPIFDNQPVEVVRSRQGQRQTVSSYHGYWIRDWFRLNPAFTDTGSTDFAIVDELIAKAGPDMRVVLDTVVNHTNPENPTAESYAWLGAAEPIPGGHGIPRSHRGLLLRDGQYVTSFDEDVFRTSNQVGYSPRYHHFPKVTNWDDPFQVEYYSLENLADVSQDNVIMAAYMRDAHAFWLKRFPDIAGYRMDTVKHVGLEYWKRFSADLFGEFPNTSVFGEDFGAGPLNGYSHPFYRDTRMSLFDFSFRFTLADMLLYGGSFKALGNLWANDPRMIDARQLVTFIDNHDIPRLRGAGMSEKRMRQAIALMMVSRGVPCLYYGIEQDLFVEGDPGDPYNRPMMSRFDQSTPMYQLVRALVGLRKTNPALRFGSTHLVHETDNIIGFERMDGAHRVFFATSKNPRDGVDSFPMVGLTLPDGTYRDILTGRSHSVVGGRVNVSLGDGDMMVLSSTAVMEDQRSRH